MGLLVVDAANVVGSRPDGWWRDRPQAARRLLQDLADADLPYDEVVLVLEGAAKGGGSEGRSEGVRIVHAPGSGDDAIVGLVAAEAAGDHAAAVTVVTADRALRSRVEAVGAQTVGPSWLLDRM